MVKGTIFYLIFLIWLTVFSGDFLYPGQQSEMSPGGAPYMQYEKTLGWLSTMLRQVEKDNKQFTLMQSYETLENRCWIYDQALAVFVLTAVGETGKAKKILDTLEYMQNKDGSFFFSYLIATLEPTSERTYTGSIAWVVMAINFYREMTGDNSYRPLVEKTLLWLAALQVSDKKDPRCGGLSLGTRNDAFSLEHNLDAYSAFRYSGIKPYKKKAKKIKRFIFANLYHNGQGRFLTGYNDDSKYLDCQSWAVLSFGKKYAHVLTFAERHFLVEDGKIGHFSGIRGFFERDAENAPVWSEGTAGAALAYYFSKNRSRGAFFHREMEKMAGENGGICYATENNYEFSTAPSVAGSAWFLFYEMKLNPFKPGRKTKKSVKKFHKKYRKYNSKK